MPSIPSTQASYFSRHQVFAGLSPDAPTVDQLLPMMVWKPLAGHQENAVGVTGPNFSVASWIAEGGSTTDSSALPSAPISFRIRRLHCDVLLSSLVQDIYSSEIGIAQLEVDAAIAAVLRATGYALINGDDTATPPQIKGVKNLAALSQTIAPAAAGAGGGPFALGDIDRLQALVTARNGRPDVLVMNLASFRMWKQLHYDAGTSPAVMPVCPHGPESCALHGGAPEDCPEGIECLTHNGCPVLVSQHVLSNEIRGGDTGLTSIYALCIGNAIGLCLTFPARAGTAPFKVERILNPLGDQERYRTTLNVGLSLYSPAALARLEGVENPA